GQAQAPRSYGVLYLSGQASSLQGGAAQGGVKFQKYRAPNQPASAKRATAPKKHATMTNAPLLSSLRMGRCPHLSVKLHGIHSSSDADQLLKGGRRSRASAM